VPENFTSRGTCDSETGAAETNAVGAAAVGSCGHACVAQPQTLITNTWIPTFTFLTLPLLISFWQVTLYGFENKTGI
jgi:hypothetical protein